MTNDVVSQLTNLPFAELLPIVQQILGVDAAPLGPLSVKQIGRSFGRGTVGIYRVSGHATTADREQTWSAVVKVIDSGVSATADGELDPQREVAVYQSGVFAALQGGVRAAQCYAIEARQGRQFVWQEDLSEAPQAPWVAKHFIETARHLGQFNGHWPESALPNWAWLNKGGLRKKYKKAHYATVFDRLGALQSHALVRRAVSPDVVRRRAQLWEASDELFAAVEATPKGVCHLDCHPRNLFPMDDPVHGTFTIAIDWASVGIDCLGADIGALLASPLKWLDLSPDEAEALVAPIFAAYLRGLVDAGWSGNEDRVRLTYFTCLGSEVNRIAAIIAGVIDEPGLRARLESAAERPIDELFERWGEAQHFFLAYSEEALQLARKF
jgi:hypothetical protein